MNLQLPVRRGAPLTAVSPTEVARNAQAAAEQVSASGDEMVSTIERVSEVVQQNSSATEQMAGSSSEVDQAMEGIAAITEENNASTAEVSAAAGEMSAQVEEVVASSEVLSQMAEELQAAVAVFTLDDDTQGSDGAALAAASGQCSPRPRAVRIRRPEPGEGVAAMLREQWGVALIGWGVLAWVPYVGWQLLGQSPPLPFIAHLGWHLSGIIPGTMLTGSSLVLQLAQRLRQLGWRPSLRVHGPAWTAREDA